MALGAITCVIADGDGIGVAGDNPCEYWCSYAGPVAMFALDVGEVLQL